MTDVARLRLDIRAAVHLGDLVGVFDLPLLVVDPDVIDLLDLGDVVDDLVDVVPGVEHHGVMRAEPDGGG